jgi:hypothetical protein
MDWTTYTLFRTDQVIHARVIADETNERHLLGSAEKLSGGGGRGGCSRSDRTPKPFVRPHFVLLTCVRSRTMLIHAKTSQVTD